MMEGLEHSAVGSAEEPPTTIPETALVNLRGFDTEERAANLGRLVGSYVCELSRHIDLKTLDGITIAADYKQALLDLDRGYSTSHKLTPTEELGVGIAMTPTVKRMGEIKSHIIIDAWVALGLESSEADRFGLALNILAHESAHVEITGRFDAAFPGYLLQHAYEDMHDAVRGQIISACWDEYAASFIAYPFGQDPTAGYEETFIHVLAVTRLKANNLIKAYRLHGDTARITGEVYGVYGDLMKFACYHLGNMAGAGLSADKLPATKAALDGHWFAPYFERLDILCKDLAEDYGKWPNHCKFEALGDLADEILAESGLEVSHLGNGQIRVNLPFTWETMPL